MGSETVSVLVLVEISVLVDEATTSSRNKRGDISPFPALSA